MLALAGDWTSVNDRSRSALASTQHGHVEGEGIWLRRRLQGLSGQAGKWPMYYVGTSLSLHGISGQWEGAYLGLASFWY